jgi:putative aldouronate transport system permease protein
VFFGIVFLAVFSWAPLFGIVIAFKDYSISSGFQGIFTSQWNNFKHFKEFFTNYRFGELLRNSIALSVLKLVFVFPAAILFALLITEVRLQFAKRFFQTVSYLPHFISWVLVYTIAYNMLSEKSGVVNMLLGSWGIQPIRFLTSKNMFYGLAVALSLWKTTGWSAIIFLAAISGVDVSLYEVAAVDGAGRLQRIWHITLPSILPAIVTVLVINIGALLGGGMGGSNFELSYLFSNPNNASMADVIQTYSFNMGLSKGRFAFATAVDLCQCVISVMLVMVSNKIAKKISGYGFF